MRWRNAEEDGVTQVTRRRLEAMVAEAARARLPDGVGKAASADPAPGPAEDPRPSPQHARPPVPPGRRAAGWFEDHAPPALQGLGLGGAQAGFVALVLVVGL